MRVPIDVADLEADAQQVAAELESQRRVREQRQAEREDVERLREFEEEGAALRARESEIQFPWGAP
jgi:hypothetical protein